MKSTRERLEWVYCRPTTEQEWFSVLGRVPSGQAHIAYALRGGEADPANENGNWWKEKKIGLTEIPVQHFDDLVHDRIVPWRLIEDGFTEEYGGLARTLVVGSVSLTVYTSHVIITSYDGHESVDTTFAGIKTYTDLLTLIRLIG